MEMHCANYYRAEKRFQISKHFLGFNDSGISEGKRISNDILLAQKISFFSTPAGAQSNGLLIPLISISMCSQSFLCELSVVLIFVLLLCYLISAPPTPPKFALKRLVSLKTIFVSIGVIFYFLI